MDNEVSGNGNQYDYGFRIYNPRLGRFLSVDPLTADYPWYTPYQFAGNKPIWAVDIDGLEEFFRTNYFVDGELWKTELTVASSAGMYGNGLEDVQHVHNSRVDIDGDRVSVKYEGSQKGENVLTEQENQEVNRLTIKNGIRFKGGISSNPEGFVRMEISEGATNSLEDLQKDPELSLKREFAGRTKIFNENKDLSPDIELPIGLNAVPKNRLKRTDHDGTVVAGTSGNKFTGAITPMGDSKDVENNFKGIQITIKAIKE